MTRPRYSIAIPTRNRPALTRIAVQTVLRQTLGDWELILSDNSENEDTRAMMSAFDDPRIRYLRVHDLSMCDNWEYAAEQARGDYLCVLEDKQALKFHALARIDEVVRARDPQVLRWQWDSLEAYGFGHRVRRNGERGDVHELSSDQALDHLVEGTYLDAKYRLPIAHYSAVRRDVLDEIRRGPLGRLFPPVSPDYTLALQVLNVCERVTYIDEGLVCFSDVSGSNGFSLRMKTDVGAAFVKSLGGDQVFYDHVPVKARTTEGAIYNDYVKLRGTLGGRLEAHPPNWANYFTACHAAIQATRQLGVDMDDELAEWERALAEQSPEVRDEVAARLEKHQARRTSPVRRLRRAPIARQLTRGAKSLVNGRLLRREDWRFDDILAYLEHDAGKRAAGRSPATAEPRKARSAQ